MDLNELSTEVIDKKAKEAKEACEKGFTFNLCDPVTKKELDCSVTVKGILANGFIDDFQNVSDNEEKISEFIAKYTISWKNVEENGKDVKFSVKEAKRIYLKYPVIATQVMQKMTELVNFYKD